MCPMPKFAKTPPEVIAAFDAASPSRSDVVRKTMFGYPALFSNGNMFAFTFGPRIVVRLSDADRAKAIKAGTKLFEPTAGRPMKEYVAVPSSATKGPALKKWIAQGLTYADTLPAKKAAKRAVKRPVKK